MIRILRRPIFAVCALSVLMAHPVPSAAQTIDEPPITEKAEKWFTWQTLPDLPDSLGLGGAFVGVSNGVLIVAGGSNFPVSKWDGGEKVYRDAIFVLEPEGTSWQTCGQLSHATAQGASVSAGDSVICIGGCDAKQCFADVTRLTWNKQTGQVDRQSLPPLPIPTSDLSAAIIEGHLYVLAGRGDHGEIHRFWRLPLDADSEAAWTELPPYPAPSRFGAALVAQNDGDHRCLYLLGGKHETTYLSNVYRFDPKVKSPEDAWQRCADIPRPSFLPATISTGQSHLFLFGGSTGVDLNRLEDLREKYRFPKEILAYHTITDTWIRAGKMPEGLAATSAVWFNGSIVLPGGEVSPGLRTPTCFSGRLEHIQRHFGPLDYIAIGLYLLAMAAIGLYFSGTTNTTKKFFLGDKRIPWLAAGISLLATQVSSIGVMAIPAKSFATNWIYLTGIATWFIVVPIVTHFFIPFFQRLEVTSAYEYLEARFSAAVRLYGSLSYCLLQLGRMAVVLYLPALALAAVTGIPVISAVVVMGVLCTIYTVAGGIQAVVWTDVVQAVVLIGGMILCLLTVVVQLDGGMAEFFSVASAHDKFQMADLRWDPLASVLWVVLVGNVFLRLSNLTSDQAVVQRYISTRDTRQARKALWADVAVSIPWALLVFSLGTALFVFYRANPHLLSPTVDTDGIVPFYVAQQLPTGVSGIVVAAIMAAAMSSMDSSLHSIATLCITDFYARFRPQSTDARRLRLARWITVALGAFGTAMAAWLAVSDVKSLWDFFQYLMGLFVGSLAGLFLLGIFTTRGNSLGALLGALTSVAVLVFVTRQTEIHFLLYSAIGVAVCVAVGYVASIVLPGSRQTFGLTAFTMNSEKGQPTVANSAKAR